MMMMIYLHVCVFPMCLQTQILLYKNRLNGSVIIDLRPRVNLGGGLYSVNNLWQGLTARDQNRAVNTAVPLPHSLFRRTINEHDQDTPILICSNCCSTTVTYLLVPHLVTHCPLCGCFMNLFR